MFAECRECVGVCGNSEGSEGKQAEWNRVLLVSVASLNFMRLCTLLFTYLLTMLVANGFFGWRWLAKFSAA